MKYTLLLCVVAGILAGCAASQKAIPTQTDVDRVSAKYPGYTLEALNKGKALYEQHCGTCHSLKKPRAFSEAVWQKEVPPMVKKANKKGANLDAAAEELILRYVITKGPASKSK